MSDSEDIHVDKDVGGEQSDPVVPIERLISRALDGRVSLDLINRKLETVPPELCQLERLTQLSLSGNCITALPSEFSRLRLRHLDISRNLLASPPVVIFQLRTLDTLELSHNRLTQLTPEISNLTALRKLGLEGNELRKLPSELNALHALVRIDLTSNLLTDLGAVDGLRNLEELYASKNHLTLLPTSLKTLEKLRILRLDRNVLTSLPAEIGDLRDLRVLDLRNNHLTSLPAELAQLQGLEVLDLRDNRLTSLPAELAHLRQLRTLHLDGNNWNEPLRTIIARGQADLFTYLQSLLDGVPCYEAKVMLVGEGNRGKTSLVAALRGEPFQRDRPTTHGIELDTLTMTESGTLPSMITDKGWSDKSLLFDDPRKAAEDVLRSKPKSLKLNTWDFGGQDLYRVTHQFFFSRRSLYLLVWNPREGGEESRVEDWLKRIRLRVIDARVILVATHCKERRGDPDYPRLYKKFGDILVSHCEVDNEDKTGIAHLLNEIGKHAARLPQMGEIISRRWLAARQQVLDLKQPQITRGEFNDVCKRNGLSDEETETLISFLHDLGYIIYYGEDEGLRDVVVVQPEWLTKAMSYVLEDRPTIDTGGVLDHSRLHFIWYDHGDPMRDRYPVQYHPYFLRLMEKFDLSYRMPEENRSLVGQLVPHTRPEIPWEPGSDLQEDQRELAMRCVMREDPPGLVAWLTVRNHRFSTSQHWRRGVFLAHQSSEALVELDGPLSINVRGPSPDYFFHILRDSLEYLIQLRWPGLVYEFEVPCFKYKKGKTRCEGNFKFDSLVKAREEGRKTIQCHGCFQDRDVSELLTGFKPPVEPLELKLEEVLKLEKEIAGTQETVADQIRRIQAVLSSENKDCPRLFCLTGSGGRRFLGIGKIEYKLQLFCEEPERQHPVEGGEYTIEIPREWLLRIAPYASVVAKVLRLAVPAVGPVLAMTVDDQRALESIKPQLVLMERLTSELLSGKFNEREPYSSPLVRPATQGIIAQAGLTEAQGAGLRQFHSLLEEVDPAKRWGDLRRVLTSSGDYLWVCPKHYREYDPGLPILPAPRTDVGGSGATTPSNLN